jgi:phosphonate transport system substrate-binding protein
VTYRVGAVAYSPSVERIWRDFAHWFAAREFALTYRLFPTYEAQIEAHFAGKLDAAWNTNLAYVRTRQRAQGHARALAMRDTDYDWTSVALVPEGAALGLNGLRGKRVGFGDSDSPQASILPAFALRREGLDPVNDLRAERLDLDVGKHGDTGGAELAQVERLRRGELDACIVSSWTLRALEASGSLRGLAVAWTSPPYHHCNFTVLDERPEHERFRALLLEMDAADPTLCEAMRQEGVNRFVEPDESGYADLIEAVCGEGS